MTREGGEAPNYRTIRKGRDTKKKNHRITQNGKKEHSKNYMMTS